MFTLEHLVGSVGGHWAATYDTCLTFVKQHGWSATKSGKNQIYQHCNHHSILLIQSYRPCVLQFTVTAAEDATL